MAEKMHHIDLTIENTAKYAIVPGDPDRCESIAQFLDNPRKIAQKREFTTYEGFIDGEKVLVTSTGIGGPSASIAIEELHMIGVDTFIRIGTCGGMQLDVIAGDVAIATGSIRAEGTTKEYMPIEYPAVPNYECIEALIEGSKKVGLNYHTGVAQSKDSYYGQHSPERMPVANDLLDKWNAYIQAGCIASEMESATLYIVCAVLGCRAGAIFHVASNQERIKAGLPNVKDFDTTNAVKASVEALRYLIQKDKAGK